MTNMNVPFFSLYTKTRITCKEKEKLVNQNDCDSELMDHYAVEERFSSVVRIPPGLKLGWIHSDTLACATLKSI